MKNVFGKLLLLTIVGANVKGPVIYYYLKEIGGTPVADPGFPVGGGVDLVGGGVDS